MSASRRLQLLEWAESSGSWIIEDDYDSEYRYESMPIASLQGLDANSRVIYIGTFSKVLFPSLRLGYVVVPPDLVPHFIAVRLALDIAPPGFFQGVLADFIREGHFSRHIRRMRILYNERRRVLIDSIDEEFGERADVTGGQAGLHLSVALKGISDLRVATRAAEQKTLVGAALLVLSGNTQQARIHLGLWQHIRGKHTQSCAQAAVATRFSVIIFNAANGVTPGLFAQNRATPVQVLNRVFLTYQLVCMLNLQQPDQSSLHNLV